MASSPLMNYRTQPAGANPWTRRLTSGFLFLALSSVLLLMVASLQVMASDLSVLPLRQRLSLIWFRQLAEACVDPPAVALFVIALRVVTLSNPDGNGISRRLSSLSHIAAIFGGIFVFSLRYAPVGLMQLLDQWAPRTINDPHLIMIILHVCILFFEMLVCAVITHSLSCVLRTHSLPKLATETWLLALGFELYILLELSLQIWMHAALTGRVDYASARLLLSVLAVATLVRLVLLAWMSIFFLRAWNAVRRGVPADLRTA